jgi:CheY-like chemotaxis protein
MNLLLADDDEDDCMFFREALDELSLSVNLTAVHDGEELMKHLQSDSSEFPDALFLDLNMPLKNGLTCLTEIRSNEKLRSLPVIIYSTSYDESIAHGLFEKGANHYICKAADFNRLKRSISSALDMIQQNRFEASIEKFFIHDDIVIPHYTQ